VVGHSALEPLKTDHTEQLLNILHISHMWQMEQGVEFAASQLIKKSLHPVHRLWLAWQYGLQDWIEIPIRMLLGTPLELYTEVNENNLDFPLYMIITTMKESIATARKCLAHHPPFPTDSDNTPFCLHHTVCKKVWYEKWFLVLGQSIHHPSEHFPIILIPERLEKMDHCGMNPECKKYVLEWIQMNFFSLIHKEEDLIRQAITTVHGMFF